MLTVMIQEKLSRYKIQLKPKGSQPKLHFCKFLTSLLDLYKAVMSDSSNQIPRKENNMSMLDKQK